MLDVCRRSLLGYDVILRNLNFGGIKLAKDDVCDDTKYHPVDSSSRYIMATVSRTRSKCRPLPCTIMTKTRNASTDDSPDEEEESATTFGPYPIVYKVGQGTY